MCKRGRRRRRLRPLPPSAARCATHNQKSLQRHARSFATPPRHCQADKRGCGVTPADWLFVSNRSPANRQHRTVLLLPCGHCWQVLLVWSLKRDVKDVESVSVWHICLHIENTFARYTWCSDAPGKKAVTSCSSFVKWAKYWKCPCA